MAVVLFRQPWSRRVFLLFFSRNFCLQVLAEIPDAAIDRVRRTSRMCSPNRAD